MNNFKMKDGELINQRQTRYKQFFNRHFAVGEMINNYNIYEVLNGYTRSKMNRW